MRERERKDRRHTVRCANTSSNKEPYKEPYKEHILHIFTRRRFIFVGTEIMRKFVPWSQFWLQSPPRGLRAECFSRLPHTASYQLSPPEAPARLLKSGYGAAAKLAYVPTRRFLQFGEVEIKFHGDQGGGVTEGN